MTIEEIRKNAPSGAQKYRVNADGSIDYYRWKNNEGMNMVLAWGKHIWYGIKAPLRAFLLLWGFSLGEILWLRWGGL